MKLKDLEIRKKLIDRGILEAKNSAWSLVNDKSCSILGMSASKAFGFGYLF